MLPMPLHSRLASFYLSNTQEPPFILLFSFFSFPFLMFVSFCLFFSHYLSVSFLSCPLSQSIDPGQQFTWENSNMEVNKPKNRYANVIAYDHSRVVLTSVDGKSSRNHSTPLIAIDRGCHRLRPPSQVPQTFCMPAAAGLEIPSLTTKHMYTFCFNIECSS